MAVLSFGRAGFHNTYGPSPQRKACWQPMPSTLHRLHYACQPRPRLAQRSGAPRPCALARASASAERRRGSRALRSQGNHWSGRACFCAPKSQRPKSVVLASWAAPRRPCAVCAGAEMIIRYLDKSRSYLTPAVALRGFPCILAMPRTSALCRWPLPAPSAYE